MSFLQQQTGFELDEHLKKVHRCAARACSEQTHCCENNANDFDGQEIAISDVKMNNFAANAAENGTLPTCC